MTHQASSPAMTCQEVRERVELYLDRALPTVESQAVQAHLLACGSCRAEIAAARAIEKRLRTAFRDGTPPSILWLRITAALRTAGRTESPQWRGLNGRPARRVAIIAAGLLAVGIVLTRQRLMTTRIGADELLQTPVNELRSFVDSGRSVDFASGDPAKLRQWFVSRVDFQPPVPPTNAGLTLIGGRLCYFFQRRIAAYMYRADGHILSLYVMFDDKIEPPSDGSGVLLDGRRAVVREVDGFGHVLWEDEPLYYSLVSDQPASRLADVARAIIATIG